MAAMKKAAVKKTAAKTKKTSNMQSFLSVNDKLFMAKYQNEGAKHQIKINKAKGKLDNLDYRASTTPAQRTKDLNRLNDTSKTLGRAKNVVSKQVKKAKEMQKLVSGKPKKK
jgi:predicted  nucleic acid-binding Zn-ribbon protein